MLYTIQNEYLQLSVESRGGELYSIRGRDGCEYLWQGDPAYWADRAPVLFPVIARLEGKQYALEGKLYPMGIHGFAAKSEFSLVAHSADGLTLRLAATAETREYYPFDFTLELSYRLRGNVIELGAQVTNHGDALMPFALGGHPGFRVPLDEGVPFESYYLEFSAPCAPERIGFTADTVLLSSQNTPYPLRDGRVLPLSHSLFDDDAIILQHADRQVTLKSDASRRSITVAYPQMPYLGFWHRPKTDAPYVCIEPWSSLPGRSGITEELACRSDFIRLPGGGTYENTWTITIKED